MLTFDVSHCRLLLVSWCIPRSLYSPRSVSSLLSFSQFNPPFFSHSSPSCSSHLSPCSAFSPCSLLFPHSAHSIVLPVLPQPLLSPSQPSILLLNSIYPLEMDQTGIQSSITPCEGVS